MYTTTQTPVTRNSIGKHRQGLILKNTENKEFVPDKLMLKLLTNLAREFLRTCYTAYVILKH